MVCLFVCLVEKKEAEEREREGGVEGKKCHRRRGRREKDEKNFLSLKPKKTPPHNFDARRSGLLIELLVVAQLRDPRELARDVAVVRSGVLFSLIERKVMMEISLFFLRG